MLRTDEYHWLRDRKSPSVRAYLHAENAYTAAMMKPSRPLQGRLYREMLSRIKETDTEVPYREGEWFYYSRTRKGRQYRIYCRRHGRLSAREEIILDLNLLARGRAYLGLGTLDISPSAGLLAYSADYTGFREYTLYIKNLADGSLLPERIAKVRSTAWASDSRTLYYVTEDAAKRASRVWRRVLGVAGSEALVYEESDERFSVSVDRSLSGDYMFITSASATTSEVRTVPAADPLSEARLFLPRRQDHEYYLDHGGDSFYIVTNDRGRNFRLVEVATDAPERANWRELIAHRDDVMLDGVDVFSRHLVAHERRGGFPALRVIRIADGTSHEIEFPEAAHAVYGGANAQFDTGTFRLYYESYVTPGTVYDYDMEGRRLRLLKRKAVRGGYDSRKYRVELVYATAGDGARIPVSMVYRKDLRERRAQPMLLTGYGAYGYPLDTHFSSARLSLLDRGVIFAVAHVRGGGEMGKRWHDEGRMLSKRNSFTDFIACAEQLIADGFTSPDRLAIEGGSAGGLLVGAVANMRPELFRAVVADVPFVDVVNTMLDASLPLTTGEYEEWGNPNTRQYFDYMLSYSPYDNIAAKDYPAMLVETSLHDSQVMYWEPAKYVARLRAHKTDVNPLLFRINMKAGHGGSSGRYDFLKEIAFSYAFVLGTLGITR